MGSYILTAIGPHFLPLINIFFLRWEGANGFTTSAKSLNLRLLLPSRDYQLVGKLEHFVTVKGIFKQKIVTFQPILAYPIWVLYKILYTSLNQDLGGVEEVKRDRDRRTHLSPLIDVWLDLKPHIVYQPTTLKSRKTHVGQSFPVKHSKWRIGKATEAIKNDEGKYVMQSELNNVFVGPVFNFTV